MLKSISLENCFVQSWNVFLFWCSLAAWSIWQTLSFLVVRRCYAGMLSLTNSLLSLKFISCQKGDGEQDSIAVKWAIFSPNPTHFFSVFFCSIRCDAIHYIDTMHKSACQKSQETFRDFCFWHMKFNMLLYCTLRVLGLFS